MHRVKNPAASCCALSYRRYGVRLAAVLGSLFSLASIQAPTALAQNASVAAANTGISARDQIALGDRAMNARLPRVALEHYELALQPEPRNYEALWKASSAAVDLGEAEKDDKKRDALNTEATDFARRSVEANPNAVGRTALSVGVRDRIKYGTEVRTQALRAIALNPKHAGALHVMGVWNAEIMRLNSMSRLLAKTVLGGQVLGTASWNDAVSYIEQSVAADPARTVHHLDQARIYRDVGRKADARAAYVATLKCPLIDANDEIYQRAAAAELKALN
jgi:tetratricopeptide (TPR) repeat protein